MKLKLLLVFTMCAMVSFAQSKSTVNNNVDTPSLSAVNNSSSNATLNAEVNYEDAVKIYPTTTEDFIYFELSELCPKFSITVYDIYGKNQKVEIYDGAIYMSQLNPGIYIIKFTCKQFSVTKNVVRK